MFSETLNTVSTLIFITFFIKCMKEGQKVRFSATKNSTYLITRNYGITELRLQFFYVSFIKVKIKALHLN